jgi:Homeodomain-like domain-containing protein
MRAKPRERARARELRGRGEPYKRIAAELGVSVNSAYRWTRDIELSDEQRRRNQVGPRGPQNPLQIARRAAAWTRLHRERRNAYQEEGRRRARDGDPLHMAGCMLYWAEGSKKRNRLTFANSDVEMVRFFATFLKESLGVRPEDCRVRLNVYTNNGLPVKEIERHWLTALELPISCLRGHSLNHYPTSSSGKKRRKLPYGVCSLTVARSTRLIQHIYGAIQEYAGFEEPRWLDGPAPKPRLKKRRDPDARLKAA